MYSSYIVNEQMYSVNEQILAQHVYSYSVNEQIRKNLDTEEAKTIVTNALDSHNS